MNPVNKELKRRSYLARAIRDTNGPFFMRVVSDKKKYKRKFKYKIVDVNQ